MLYAEDLPLKSSHFSSGLCPKAFLCLAAPTFARAPRKLSKTSGMAAQEICSLQVLVDIDFVAQYWAREPQQPRQRGCAF